MQRSIHYIKTNNRGRKAFTETSETLCSESSIGLSCMICMHQPISSTELLPKFCTHCLNKLMCPSCILEITSQPCPFCHTNNAIWRKTKRQILFADIQKKIAGRRRFWQALRIKEKNVHMQYAIRNGIQEYIHKLDTLVQKLTEDIKYLVKTDFQREGESQVEVLREIEEINTMEERYDRMMIDLKNDFGVELHVES